MIAVTGHHVGMCCVFCDVELHAGDPPVCLNADCFLFGWPCPLPVQRMIRNPPPRRGPSGPNPGLPYGPAPGGRRPQTANAETY